MKMNARLPYALLAAGLLTGCFKEVATTTRYTLQPYVQEHSSAAYEPLQGVEAFAFAADTTLWTVASYDEALEGIITNRARPEEKMRADAAAQPADPAEKGWVEMEVEATPQMIVAIDTEHRLYAYTQQQLVENLPRLYVSMIFKPWKKGFSYKGGNWRFFNDFYSPPRQTVCYVGAAVQAAEGGAATPVEDAQKLRVYAFAADTTRWQVTSFADADAGRIVMKEDPRKTTDNPNYTGYLDRESNLFRFDSEEATLMLVIVDRQNRIYAYSEQHLDLGGDPVTFDVTFRPWVGVERYAEEEWRYVGPKPAEQPETPDAEQPETPETPDPENPEQPDTPGQPEEPAPENPVQNR